MRVLCGSSYRMTVKPQIPAVLPCRIGSHVGTPGGYADPQIELYPVIQAIVQHARGIYAAKAPAHISDADFFHTCPEDVRMLRHLYRFCLLTNLLADMKEVRPTIRDYRAHPISSLTS